jgi:hypothetical protein
MEQLGLNPTKIHLDGLLGSSVSFITELYLWASFFVVLNDKEAAYYLNDLEQMIGEQDVLFYQVLIAVRTKLKTRTMPMYCSVPRCLTE